MYFWPAKFWMLVCRAINKTRQVENNLPNTTAVIWCSDMFMSQKKMLSSLVLTKLSGWKKNQNLKYGSPAELGLAGPSNDWLSAGFFKTGSWTKTAKPFLTSCPYWAWNRTESWRSTFNLKNFVIDHVLSCKMDNALRPWGFYKVLMASWTHWLWVCYFDNPKFLIKSARKEISVEHIPCKDVFWLCMLLNCQLLIAFYTVLIC